MSNREFTYNSGYKFMWVMVLFDLPTTTPEERSCYTNFRGFLLDTGFEMAMPPDGKVDILQFTDKQYENIVCLRGRRRDSPKENPTQLVLF